MSEEHGIEESFEEMEFTRKKAIHAVVSFALSGLVMVALIGSVIVLKMFASEPEEAKTKALVSAVNVLEVREKDRALQVVTQGVVESVQDVTISAEVGGRVESVSKNLLKGASVAKDELLVELEKADYISALRRAEANQEEADLLLRQEEARRDQAQRDWEKLGRGEPGGLVLREPHIRAARARLNSAKEEVKRAMRDRDRTEIRAPFAGVVSQESVEFGAILAPGSMVARIYSPENLEIRLPVSLEDFGALARNAEGLVVGDVKLTGLIGLERFRWDGDIVRMDGQIDSETLTATVIVRIRKSERNPAYLRWPPVGMFLKAEVPGRVLEGVVEIPRMALRGKDQVLVVDDEGNMLDRQVTVLRTMRKTVLVSKGLEEGDVLIVTRMSGVVDERKVEVVERFTELSDVIAEEQDGEGEGAEEETP